MSKTAEEWINQGRNVRFIVVLSKGRHINPSGHAAKLTPDTEVP